MPDECELLEDQLAGLFVEAFGDGNEGTLDELIYAFVARVLSEEECERLGIEGGEGGVRGLEFKRILEKLIQSLETSTIQDVRGRDTGEDP